MLLPLMLPTKPSDPDLTKVSHKKLVGIKTTPCSVVTHLLSAVL